MDLNLEGRRALVCGSTQGMGLAIAKELNNQGAAVTLFARNEEEMKKIVAEMSGNNNDY